MLWVLGVGFLLMVCLFDAHPPSPQHTTYHHCKARDLRTATESLPVNARFERRNELKCGDLLGSGSYGSVFTGKLAEEVRKES